MNDEARAPCTIYSFMLVDGTMEWAVLGGIVGDLLSCPSRCRDGSEVGMTGGHDEKRRDA
jgi:hypothetical protein